MVEAAFIECPHCGKEGIKEGYEGERCLFCGELLESRCKAMSSGIDQVMRVAEGCPDCGGDLAWILWGFKRVWQCKKCGRILSEEERVKPSVRDSGKRKYTKGDKFFNRYPSVKPLAERAAAVKLKVLSPDYWEGYRQAVLDGAPRYKPIVGEMEVQ